MIHFKFLFGLYSKTETIENKEAALIAEFNDLQAYLKSDELERYFFLKKNIESEAFRKKEQEIKLLVYKNSEAFAKEQEYNKLRKSARIVNYYKVLASPMYKNYTGLVGSELLATFGQHRNIVQSPAFSQKQQELKNLIYKTSAAFKNETEFKALVASKAIKNHIKILQSEGFKLYNLLNGSDDLLHFIKIRDYSLAHPNALKKKNKSNEDGSEIDIEAIKEYETLKKDKRFIQYFKFEVSKEFALYRETEKNGSYAKYIQLKELTESASFKEQKAYLLLPYARKWEQTDEAKHESAYKALLADTRIKDYLKFEPSKELALFNEVEKMGEAEHFQTLEAYIKSDVFKEEKAYLLLSAKEKWQKTEEYAMFVEYNQIIASAKHKWYFKVVNSPKFNEIKKWQITFEDNFETGSIDPEKWLTRYFWGDNTIHDSYSLSDDLHFNTDGKNLKLANSILNIETRKETTEGKAWTPMFGFMPRSFDYTSGLVNTGKSFRQKYGRFRAKIKMAENSDITNTFWMVGNQMLPHIDIVKFHRNKFFLSNFWQEGADFKLMKNISSMFAPRLSRAYYIFELEWTPEVLIWRINNLEILRQTHGIPDEEMYIQLSAGLFDVKPNSNFPAAMQIDWVRCYGNTPKV